MGKIKVYELAKELDIQSKEIASFLEANDIGKELTLDWVFCRAAKAGSSC